jgi:hypothetical protein
MGDRARIINQKRLKAKPHGHSLKKGQKRNESRHWAQRRDQERRLNETLETGGFFDFILARN